jgi:hypothetical protein
MPVNTAVVGELRSLFKDGATPSRLIRHICERHQGDPLLYALIPDYFSQAFSAPAARLAKRGESYSGDDLRHAHLNVDLIHRMLQRRGEWDHEPEVSGEGAKSWFDGLAATDEAQLIEQADLEASAALAGAAKHLDRDAQRQVQRLVGNVHALLEKVEILARLSERLQQQVSALENQLAESSLPEV